MDAEVTPSGFAAMGLPVPFSRRQRAYDWLVHDIGLTSECAFALVDILSYQLEKDKPFEAMESARRSLDLTGAYRLLATLITDRP
jgi:hypothetical protein